MMAARGRRSAATTLVPHTTHAAEEPGPTSYDRADAHIYLANEHGDEVGPGKASASFLFAVSRYNAFVVAAHSASAEGMQGDRAAAVDYFVEQYRSMLEDNVDDFIGYFDRNLRGGQA